jgi:hypothetical protein
MKKVVLIIVGLIAYLGAFAGFKDSCTVTYYSHVGHGVYITHEVTVPVEFYTGYEMNKMEASDAHLDNTIIAVVQSDELDTPTIYISNFTATVKLLTREELKSWLVQFYGDTPKIMCAYDGQGKRYELVLKETGK